MEPNKREEAFLSESRAFYVALPHISVAQAIPALRTKDAPLLPLVTKDNLGKSFDIQKPAPIDIEHPKPETLLDDTALRYGWYIFVHVHVRGRMRQSM